MPNKPNKSFWKKITVFELINETPKRQKITHFLKEATNLLKR